MIEQLDRWQDLELIDSRVALTAVFPYFTSSRLNFFVASIQYIKHTVITQDKTVEYVIHILTSNNCNHDWKYVVMVCINKFIVINENVRPVIIYFRMTRTRFAEVNSSRNPITGRQQAGVNPFHTYLKLASLIRLLFRGHY